MLKILILLIPILAGVSSALARAYPPDLVDRLQAESIPKLRDYLARLPATRGCTLETAIKRYEWSDISDKDRQAYVQAVECLQSKPPIIDPALVPGARSRFDDFLAVHINQTLSIHRTANFLAWHRYYLWAYEKALRDECGYSGHQPYWNWDRYAANPEQSPLFDGSPSSMGSNGAYVEYNGVFHPDGVPPLNRIPPAGGGGCVTHGPFANMSVNLGPMSAVMPNVPSNARPDGFGYNPRCLRRDINKHAAVFTTANHTLSLIVNNTDIDSFQTVMQVGNMEVGDWGVHGGGHFTNGGDPGGDFYTSPGDPVFFLHHAMIDRVWWIWQLQDLATRLTAIAGTLTLANTPPSRNATLDDLSDLGVLGAPVRLGELLSTMGGLDGSFCYIYV